MLVNDLDIAPDLKAAVSAATRQAQHPLAIHGNYSLIARPHQESRFEERYIKLLRYIGYRCKRPGVTVELISDLDYPVADANDSVELEFYILTASKLGLLTQVIPQAAGIGWKCSLTLEGWKSIEPSRQIGGTPGTCFVALAMIAGTEPDMERAYFDAIKPALKACGYQSRCMFEIHTIEGITDRVLAEIRQAQFIVADFTHQRQSVYFEAGFAQGLGRQVVWSVHSKDKEAKHFDTRHLGHVTWNEALDLKQSLIDRIQATIFRQT